MQEGATGRHLVAGLGGCRLGDAQGSRERRSAVILAQEDPNLAGLWGFGEIFFTSICFKEQFPWKAFPPGHWGREQGAWARAGGCGMEKQTHLPGGERRKRALGHGFLQISLGKT